MAAALADPQSALASEVTNNEPTRSPSYSCLQLLLYLPVAVTVKGTLESPRGTCSGRMDLE